MDRTARIWEHADAAFAEADKAFAEADRVFNELPRNRFIRSDKVGTVHQLRFVADSKRERWRLTKKFIKMAWAILFTGKTQLHFKDR